MQATFLITETEKLGQNFIFKGVNKCTQQSDGEADSHMEVRVLVICGTL